MNKQQLAAKIWDSANKMRSSIEANEYKDYILGFIFYRFLSEKETSYLKAHDWTDEYLPELTEEDEETVQNIQQNLGYYIAYENLFQTWLDRGVDFTVDDVRIALSAFDRLISETHKRVFKGIFDTLQTGLSKLGNTAEAQSRAIRDLVQLIRDIPMDGRQGYDVLGFIYEYLIEKFASNAGKKAGEFYTPHEVSLLMSEIVANHLRDRDKIEIYDPTSGSGSLLINIGKSALKYLGNADRIKYYAQEKIKSTYDLTRMNLIMRGIEADNIMARNGDTLEDDWPYFDDNDPVGTYNPLYVDAVVSNPPYSQAWSPTDKESDPRYAGYGLAPKGKADYAFLLHDLYHIKPDGIMTIVLPHGVLFRGGEEGEIRKNLIEKNKIDTIIGLPANIFYGTGIPTIIMILKQKRTNTDVQIIDASKGFIKEGKNNKLRASDIKRIVDAIQQRKDENRFSRVVSRDEIRANDYNLNIPRYVDSSETAESWDIYASMFGGIPVSEINQLEEYWHAFPTLREDLFEPISAEHCKFKTSDIPNVVHNHENVESFQQHFREAFDNYELHLHNTLIDKMEELSIARTEEALAQNLFARLENIPLVDSYEAYQLMHDQWEDIRMDLEVIQTEGKEAIQMVDPNWVIKKKGGKDQEVQDGWKGHILPFELVQNEMLTGELQALKSKENRLSEIESALEELLDSLTEEEREGQYVGDNGWSFSDVKKALKTGDLEPETLAKLKEALDLNTEEKALKSAIKKDRAALEEKTKITIENLTDEEALNLLHNKWVKPLIDSILSLPGEVIRDLLAKLQALDKKYANTLMDLEQEIRETEAALSGMIDQLEGSELDLRGLHELQKLLGGEFHE